MLAAPKNLVIEQRSNMGGIDVRFDGAYVLPLYPGGDASSIEEDSLRLDIEILGRAWVGNNWDLDGDELDIHMGVNIYGDRPIWVFEMEQVNLS